MTDIKNAPKSRAPAAAAPDATTPSPTDETETAPTAEVGGPEGPDPTRFGDWERKGRCIDF